MQKPSTTMDEKKILDLLALILVYWDLVEALSQDIFSPFQTLYRE